jgi:hypothetical protein
MARKIAPRAAAADAGEAFSTSSAFTPTFPIWGKVKVTIWPA